MLYVFGRNKRESPQWFFHIRKPPLKSREENAFKLSESFGDRVAFSIRNFTKFGL